MRWNCPFRQARRQRCRLFDGECDPEGEACFMNSGRAADAEDEAHRVILQEMPRPEMSSAPAHDRSPFKRRVARGTPDES
jgi:hypothetical protein